MCKVSLILPSLNVEKYMEECLQSVTGQTLGEIEIICVDAGSTDGTLEIIGRFAQKDPRIRLILSDKKSYGYQMNLGISEAKGEYIGIVETDDYVPRRMYEELYAIAVRERAEIVKADFYRFCTKGDKVERIYNRLDPSDKYYGRVIHPAEHPQVFRLIMNTWSGIYLRSFLEDNRITHNESPGASYQDNGFWFKTFACAERVYFVNEPYYMNRRDNDASSVANPGKVYCMTEEWAHIYSWLKEDETRFKTFIGVYTLRKYHSLLTTYDRIAPQYREAFIRHMGEEMGRLIRAGEYEREAFTAYEWKMLSLIVSRPMMYHSVRVCGCSHLFTARVLDRVKKHGALYRLIRTADRIFNKAEIVLAWAAYEGLTRTIHRIKWKYVLDRVGKEVSYG